MHLEVQAACRYWLSAFNSNNLSQPQKETFVTELLSLMKSKFQNHWYEQVPERGQGFRSMICHPQSDQIDPMLVEAAARANFQISSVFKERQGLRMWIDPNEVEVESVSSTAARNRTRIYPETLSSHSYHHAQQYSFGMDENMYHYPVGPYDSYPSYSVHDSVDSYSSHGAPSSWNYPYSNQQTDPYAPDFPVTV